MIKHFLDAWNDPAMRHAMVGHFPIVLSMVGLVLAVALAVGKGRSKALRWVTLGVFIALLTCAFVTKQSGEKAHDAVSGSLDDPAHELLEEHEELGEKVWLFAIGLVLLVGATFVSKPMVRLPAAWVAVAGGLFVAGWVANTADHGGRLVYEHGAGTPDRLAELLAEGKAGLSASDPRVAFFRDEVRPILADNCWRCHNPSKRRSGNLDQTTIEGMLTGGHSGPAIVPGRPDESLLIQAVRWESEDLEMPMGEDQLPAEMIAKLERWVREGAVWEALEVGAGKEGGD